MKKKLLAVFVAMSMMALILMSGLSPQNASAKQTKAKEITISVATWDCPNIDDPVGKKLQADNNVKIELMPLSWDDYGDKVKLWAAAGTLPDVTATDTVEQDLTRFYQWIDQGVIRSIPDKMLNKYPTLKKVFEQSEVAQTVKKIKGAYYFIPRVSSIKDYYKADQWGLYFRKDWMNKVGFKNAPKTTDELYRMLKAFVYLDPDGNKKKDTIGLTAAGMDSLTAIFYMYGANPFDWVLEGGKYIPGYLSKKNIAALKFIKKLYDEKILDPEFAQAKWKNTVSKFSQNKAGALYRKMDLYWINRVIVKNFHEANPQIKNPLDYVGVMDPISKDSKTKPTWGYLLETGGSEISSKVNDEKLDRILSMYDYMLDKKKGWMLMNWGVEGINYKMENGKPVTIPQPENTVNNTLAAFSNLTDWHWDNDIEFNDKISKPIKNLSAHLRKVYNPIVVKPNAVVRYLSTPAKDNITLIWQDEFAKIVLSKGNVDKMFADFVKTSLSAGGVEQAINEVNSKAKQLKLIK